MNRANLLKGPRLLDPFILCKSHSEEKVGALRDSKLTLTLRTC